MGSCGASSHVFGQCAVPLAVRCAEERAGTCHPMLPAAAGTTPLTPVVSRHLPARPPARPPRLPRVLAGGGRPPRAALCQRLRLPQHPGTGWAGGWMEVFFVSVSGWVGGGGGRVGLGDGCGIHGAWSLLHAANRRGASGLRHSLSLYMDGPPTSSQCAKGRGALSQARAERLCTGLCRAAGSAALPCRLPAALAPALCRLPRALTLRAVLLPFVTGPDAQDQGGQVRV